MKNKKLIAAAIVAGLVMTAPAHAGSVAAILDINAPLTWWDWLQGLTHGPIIIPGG